ncbi:hypothetical protein SAMN06296386_11157 [Lachnospiraceae bacterium]|nr:hypothetical protein SAMN06296386_11157 [Lachnospiraceae bacterium]
MRRDWKKVLSLVLAASLALTMNTVAFADTTSENATAIEEATQETTETAEEASSEVAESTEESATEVADAVDETVSEQEAAASEAVAEETEEESDSVAEVASVEEFIDVNENVTVSASTLKPLSGNFAKFLRSYSDYTISGTNLIWQPVEYVYGTTYVPGKATVSSIDLGIKDGDRELQLFYEYYDHNPWYDARTREWDGVYKKANGKLTKAVGGTTGISKSVSADAALVWYDKTKNTYTAVDGVRIKSLSIKNSKNASKDLSGNELTENPKYKNCYLLFKLNINKKKSGLTSEEIKQIQKLLKGNSNHDYRFDFGILRRSLSGNAAQGSQGIYSSLKLKTKSFTIKNLKMRLRFLNSEGEGDDASNTYQDKLINIKLPKKTGATGKSMAEKKVTYGAYCEEFSKQDGTVKLVGVNNFEGEVLLTTNSQYGTFTYGEEE